jgi:ceramide glucosyltransferase
VSIVHIAVAATAVSFALYATMLSLFARAMKTRRGPKCADLEAAPRVTIFKPLAGSDDDLDDNLASFARIDYPSFEVLFGVADSSDPAFAAARRFLARYPKVDARLVVTDPQAALNPKVAQLVGLERVATGDVWVISDSNVRVGPTYLWSLVAELEDERVGLVASLFSGTGERSLGAAMENLQICASTAPGLAAIDTVSSRPFTIGKSMACRRRDLMALGGFQSVGHVLAEDHVLRRRFLAAGLKTRTSFDVVENRNVACTVSRTIERHTRWAKLRRSLNPTGFIAEPMLTPVVVASGGVVAAPCKLTAGLLVAVCLAQTACALLAVRLLRGRALAWWYAPLEIARSYVTFLCWAFACVSRRIAWRGHPFSLRRGTVIVPDEAQRSAGRAGLPA